ncbi:hypothetical protein BO79DRAFT_226336 [Aspergillus costaricaensis CBS 115574]|uniref:Uncharacterized protein n=1 Tax=Aspergillus costaricaensis CBS 115574 TaxID=1448317 RepID=A0ACD1IL36_9EURO|nr:hypothetical protein BO79DRAFT_226336 [Aspergillus costaricaensis CBS 115574]RAK91197.1 hypothetical protein BO79DRAFT_226336 [Aspergillus costaricaensis CBS 115574]
MSFLGGAECSTAGNPLTQFTKHVQDDKSLQRDRLVGRGPGGMQEGMRSRGMMGGQDQMMDEFAQQPGQIPGAPPQPFAMEQLRRELDQFQTTPPRTGSPGWAAEFDAGEHARMEAAFAGPQGPMMNNASGFTPAEFARFQQQSRAGMPQTANPVASAPSPMMAGYQRPMGMGGYMGMGGMGMMPQTFNPMAMQQQPAEATTQDKGKGRMVELDDENWEAQFAEMETADTQKLDDEANAAVEAELNDLDRSVPQESGDSAFESVWQRVQAETATNRKLAEGETDFNIDDNLHMGEMGEWDGFDTLNTRFRNPQLGDYMFEEDNVFRSVNNPFEEGVKIMREGGNLSLAALAFEAAVQKDPQHVQAWTMLGSAQAQNEKELPAIRALEQALKIDANNLDALMGLAVSYTNEGYDSTSYRTLERWLSVKYPHIINPNDVSSDADLGFTDRQLLHDRVTDLFIQAAQLSPSGEQMDPDVQVGLGVLFYCAEEYDKAVDCFSAALASTESGTSNQQEQLHLLWNRLGATLANSGRSEEAIEAYEQALNINPNFVRARYNLGVSCINIGCYPEAAQHLLGALSMHRVVEQEGRERAREIVGGEGGIDDEQLDRMIHVSQNQSTNLRKFPLYTMAVVTGAQLIARSLRDLGVTVIFGIVGIPVVEIAEEAINLGIRFVAFRNEQACSYAASVYGYMTGRPGVCLVVGGPGVLHALAGIGNSSANNFPLLVLAGSAETTGVTKGAFQELDAISLLTPHTKLAVRASSLDFIPGAVKNAYRTCWYGRPGPTFVDLPADIIQGKSSPGYRLPQPETLLVPSPPKASGDPALILKAAQLLRTARSPLLVIGKGAAYARAELGINQLVDQTQIPFLPTPMGKGVVPDSHPLNASSARSAALKHADVVLILGARLNWILHYGEAPKWNPKAKIIQVDICAEEIGRNAGTAELGILGDIGLVVDQLLSSLSNWKYSPTSSQSSSSNKPNETFTSILTISANRNELKAQTAALRPTPPNTPLTYQRAYHIIKSTLNTLSPFEQGNIIYVSEGANTMDISRSIFPLNHPRQRLDAGTYATMGVGMGYIVAAHEAYNALPSTTSTKPKKIVAFEGDSAFGFSAMEIETLARYRIPALIYVVNNSGIYHGDSVSEDDWRVLQGQTVGNDTKASESGGGGGAGGTKKGLRSTSLLYETRYEMLATMCGGKGFFVRTEEELERATREGFESECVTVVNVIVEPGIGKEIGFAWQGKGKGDDASTEREAKL